METLYYHYAFVNRDGFVNEIIQYATQEEAPTDTENHFYIYLGHDVSGAFSSYLEKRYIFETGTWEDIVYYHYAILGEFNIFQNMVMSFNGNEATPKKILMPDCRDKRYYDSTKIVSFRGRQYDVINSTPTNPIFRYFNPAAEYGSYAGNGATSRAFDLGFSPSAVFICRNDGATKDGSTITGGLAVPNHPVTDGTTVAIEITATGFTVHRGGTANLNMSAKTYNYVVIR